MSSILTNNSAMVALQTLKGINKSLADTQSNISTGKVINTAKDNSAIWAISKVMESDVAGFEAISSSLALGESTVAVASAGAERITDIFKDMKKLIVDATGENKDHTKIGDQIQSMKDEITSIIGGAQFNGANLLSTGGAEDGQGNPGIDILSSLDRSGAGVAAVNIAVASLDFEANLDLSTIDVTDSAAAEASLAEIETLMETAITGAAALGASAKRIEDQQTFVGKLTDAMKSGIGTLVDADMEEASARLQALQVQQQLGVQALSIANQAPQNILSLFR